MNLDDEHFFKNVYSAMEEDETDKDYLANVAMAAYSVIKTYESFKNVKSNLRSECYREEGNKAYKDGFFQTALVLYNKALVYAPNTSLALKLAYSNRSAVLFSTKQYRACEDDCKTALAINCPTPNSITEKLEKRKFQAKHNQDFEKSKFACIEVYRRYACDYFKLKSRHIDIPCASADIEIVFESGVPKVLAKRNIPIGSMVALEKAFVSWAAKESNYSNCYYCRKLDLNLIPCTGCVVALFCSKQCKDICMKEYHSVECEIIGNIAHFQSNKRMMANAIIKLRNMCSSWEELIALSYKGYHGKDTLKANEIYDGNNPSSLLYFKKDRHFLHGAIFNQSHFCAVLLNAFNNVPFLPQDLEGKQSALKAMARILMNWGLYCTTTNINLATYVVDINTISYRILRHEGLFPFISKLKHSCMPNLQSVSINNSMALFAFEQIEAGTELTITHTILWLDRETVNIFDQYKNSISRLLYETCHLTCSCFVCSYNYDERTKLVKDAITDSQKQAARECCTLQQCGTFGIHKCIDNLFKTLALLNNVKFSAEYTNVYINLFKIQLLLVYVRLNNTILSMNG